VKILAHESAVLAWDDSTIVVSQKRVEQVFIDQPKGCSRSGHMSRQTGFRLTAHAPKRLNLQHMGPICSIRSSAQVIEKEDLAGSGWVSGLRLSSGSIRYQGSPLESQSLALGKT
jgi:hypothetical protein